MEATKKSFRTRFLAQHCEHFNIYFLLLFAKSISGQLENIIFPEMKRSTIFKPQQSVSTPGAKFKIGPNRPSNLSIDFQLRFWHACAWCWENLSALSLFQFRARFDVFSLFLSRKNALGSAKRNNFTLVSSTWTDCRQCASSFMFVSSRNHKYCIKQHSYPMTLFCTFKMITIFLSKKCLYAELSV